MTIPKNININEKDSLGRYRYVTVTNNKTGYTKVYDTKTGRTSEYNKAGHKVVRLYKNVPKSMIKRGARAKNHSKFYRVNELTRKGRSIAAVFEAMKRKIKSAPSRKSKADRSKERAINLAVLRREPGQRTLRVLSEASAQAYLKRIRNAPFTESYRENIRAYVRSLRPHKSILSHKPRYGTIEVDGVVFGADTKRARNYLSNLKKTIARDRAFKRDWHDTIRRSGLFVNKGDKWYVKAYKGAGVAGLGVLRSGRFLANASDKLVAGVAGLGAGREFRQAVGQESFRSLKKTPGAVWAGLDPRKPENWANIILFATAVAAKGYSLKTANQDYAVATKALKKVRSARIRAKKMVLKTGKGKSVYRSLLRKESQLRKVVARLDKARGLPNRLLKVKAKTKGGVRLKKQTIRVTHKREKESDLEELQKAKNRFRKSASESYQRKKSGFTRKKSLQAAREIKKSVIRPKSKKPEVEVAIIKKGSKVKPVIRIKTPRKSYAINKPVARGGDSVEITTSNGQKLLLKTVQRTKTRTVARSASKARMKQFSLKTPKVIVVKKPVIRQVKSFYESLLALAKVGHPANKLSSVLAGKLRFFNLLVHGTVDKSLVASKTSSLQREVVAVRSVQSTASKAAVSSASAFRSKVSSLLRSSTVSAYEQINELLEQTVRKVQPKKKPVTRLRLPRVRKRMSRERAKRVIAYYWRLLPVAYRPSLVAIFYGITGEKPPSSFTGFEIRPIIKKKKKKNDKGDVKMIGDIKKGALHRQLGIPVGRRIPKRLLEKIRVATIGRVIRNPTKTGKRLIKVTRLLKARAVFALNFAK